MCKRVLQDEVAKRRDLELRLRPVASAFYAFRRNSRIIPGTELLLALEDLIIDLGIRECCYTMKTEKHTEACRG